MRASIVNRYDICSTNCTMLPSQTVSAGFSSLVADEDQFLPMESFVEINRLSIRRMASGELLVRNNAGIATPCGVWIWLDWSPLLSTYIQASNRWTLAGVTRDSTGAPLGTCVVKVHETGRLAVTSTPPEQFHSAGNPNPADWQSPASMVVETISDGSGNYSVEVPMNTAYQATGYKAGAPDVAGITRNDIVPVSNN
jgi:hypothetical protein